jgi:archaetidylinositol phosphate synthase
MNIGRFVRNIEDYRAVFQHRILSPATAVIARMGARPLHLNVLALAFGLLCAIFVAQGGLRTAAVMLALSTLADGLDGDLARALRLDSDFGAFVDSVFDRYVDLAILLAISWHFRHETPKYMLLTDATIVGTVVTSYSRARGESLVKSVGSKGILTRAERMVLLLVGFAYPPTLRAVIWMLAVLSNVTAVQRIWLYCSLVNREPRGKSM